MSTHTELVIWKVRSCIDRAKADESIFASRKAAEAEKSLLRHTYGDRATIRLTPVTVRRVEAVAR
jgi:hypothetical protein